MKKILRILENTSLGLFVNGGFYLIMEDITFKSILVTLIFFYVMTMSIILQED